MDGLGITNIKHQNFAFSYKWIIKLLDEEED